MFRVFLPLLIGAMLLFAACTPDDGNGGQTDSSSSISRSSQMASSVTPLSEEYTNATLGYSIRYPEEWTVEEDNLLVTNQSAFSGTAFVVPNAMIEGTMVLDARVHVARNLTCPAYADETEELIGGRRFMRATWSGAGAGNFYSGDVYMLPEDDRCFVFTFYTHRCNLGPGCGARSAALDLMPLTGAFRAMVASFSPSEPAVSFATYQEFEGRLIDIDLIADNPIFLY